MENLKLYESFVEEINEAKIKKGLMHDLLNIHRIKKYLMLIKTPRKMQKNLHTTY